MTLSLLLDLEFFHRTVPRLAPENLGESHFSTKFFENELDWRIMEYYGGGNLYAIVTNKFQTTFNHLLQYYPHFMYKNTEILKSNNARDCFRVYQEQPDFLAWIFDAQTMRSGFCLFEFVNGNNSLRDSATFVEGIFSSFFEKPNADLRFKFLYKNVTAVPLTKKLSNAQLAVNTVADGQYFKTDFVFTHPTTVSYIDFTNIESYSTDGTYFYSGTKFYTPTDTTVRTGTFAKVDKLIEKITVRHSSQELPKFDVYVPEEIEIRLEEKTYSTFNCSFLPNLTTSIANAAYLFHGEGPKSSPDVPLHYSRMPKTRVLHYPRSTYGKVFHDFMLQNATAMISFIFKSSNADENVLIVKVSGTNETIYFGTNDIYLLPDNWNKVELIITKTKQIFFMNDNLVNEKMFQIASNFSVYFAVEDTINIETSGLKHFEVKNNMDNKLMISPGPNLLKVSSSSIHSIEKLDNWKLSFRINLPQLLPKITSTFLRLQFAGLKTFTDKIDDIISVTLIDNQLIINCNDEILECSAKCTLGKNKNYLVTLTYNGSLSVKLNNIDCDTNSQTAGKLVGYKNVVLQVEDNLPFQLRFLKLENEGAAHWYATARSLKSVEQVPEIKSVQPGIV